MRIGLLLIGFLLCGELHAEKTHPVTISWVTANLLEDRVVLNVKISAEDLLYFHPIEPDSLFHLNRVQLLGSAKAHESIIRDAFQIRNQNNQSLPSSFIKGDYSSISQTQQFDVMELMKFPLYYQLEFALDSSTQLLTFSQKMEVNVPVISFLSISKNGKILVENTELDAHQPFTMNRDAVSIGSKAEMNTMLSYITLSDTKIAHEMTISYKLLKSLMGQVKAGDSLIYYESFFQENSSVEINGILITPKITQLTIQNLSSQASLNDYSLINVRVEYALTDLPLDVIITWDSFNWQVRWFQSFIDAFGETIEHKFSRFNPQFDWKRSQEVNLEKN